MPSNHEMWPSATYFQQVEHLRSLVGQPVYVVEINETDINAGVKFPAKPLTLLAIIDYPRPDPYRQLCPHLVVLDDGRGINLGRIARITQNTAFQPKVDDILFINQDFVQGVLFAPRTLSRESVRATSTALLAQMFGNEPGKLLELYAEPAVSVLAVPTNGDKAT